MVCPLAYAPDGCNSLWGSSYVFGMPRLESVDRIADEDAYARCGQAWRDTTSGRIIRRSPEKGLPWPLNFAAHCGMPDEARSKNRNLLPSGMRPHRTQ